MAYRLRVLGPFQLLDPSGAPLSIPARKNQALVAILALAAGAEVPRNRLMAILWGDRGEDQARSSLRQALAALRKSFPEGAFPFTVTDRFAAIDPAALTVDALSLDVDGGMPGGEFLEGLDIPGAAAEEWLRAERHRLATLSAGRRLARAERLEAAGDLAAAAEAAQGLVSDDPLDEAAHRALMRIYAATGDRSRALRQFQACCDALRSGLGVGPSAETAGLHDRLRAGDGPAVPVAIPSTGRPTVAVLPFANLSPDPDHAYFADGITDDVITELGRFRGFNVSARNSAFRFRDDPAGARAVGEALGARFVVEGTIRKASNRVRISVRLTETSEGRQLWAEHFDRELVDIFAVQDEITGAVSGIVQGRVDADVERHSRRIPPDKLGAYELCLRAKALVWTFRRKENAAARDLLERALELDPMSAAAHSFLSTAHHNAFTCCWVEDRDRSLELAAEHARIAVDLDNRDSRARWRLAEALQYLGDLSRARGQFEMALQLNPNDSEVLSLFGFFLSGMGEHDRALELFERAAVVDPFDSFVRYWLHGVACYNAGRYEEAIDLLTRVHDPIPEIHAWLAACFARTGRADEAARQIGAFRDQAAREMTGFDWGLHSDWEAYLRSFGFGNAAVAAHFLDGIRVALRAANR